MKKKFFNWPVIIAVLATMLLMVNINAMAQRYEDSPASKIVTDKSDRSLIKEVLLNQKQMMSMLKDIKASCKAK